MLPFRFSLFCFWLFTAVLPFSPPWCSVPSLFSLLSFEVAFFGLCGVCSFCGVWCLLSSSSPFRGPLFLRWPSPSVLLLPLSPGACRSFSFSLSSFGSEVSVFLRSFWLLRLFSFFSALSRVLCPLLPQDPPLGSCVLLFRLWLVCPPLGFSNYVSPYSGPPGCFLGGFPPLPVLLSTFSCVAQSPYVVRCCSLPCSLSERSQRYLLLSSLPGNCSSCLTFWCG